MIKEKRQSLGASLSSKESRSAVAKAMWRAHKAYKACAAATKELTAALEQLKEARQVP